jgi:hypothetical protein
MSRLVDALTANGPLTVPAATALDIVDVVNSLPTFAAFVHRCGWSTEQFKAWAYLALTQLLPPSPPGRSARLDIAATRDLSYHADILNRLTERQ